MAQEGKESYQDIITHKCCWYSSHLFHPIKFMHNQCYSVHICSTTEQLRPISLAEYSKSSALARSDAETVVRVGTQHVPPILTVTLSEMSLSGKSMARPSTPLQTLSANSLEPLISVLGNTAQNSSPPNRATKSTGRLNWLSRYWAI